MHQHDLAAAAVARHVDEIGERSDLVDFDLRFLLGPLSFVLVLVQAFDEAIVGMRAGFEPRASRTAATAEPSAAGAFAEQRLREPARERELADAPRSLNEQRVGQVRLSGQETRKRLPMTI